MTARPLADCTLAPVIPASATSPQSGQNPCAWPAAISEAPQSERPTTSTSRSPIRSVGRPQRNSVTSEPTSEAEIRTPVSASDRWSRARRAGAITATPNRIAEYVVCANVPAARTAQR